MADEILSRDENRKVVLAGVTDDANLDVVQLRVDPSSKKLKVTGTFANVATAPGSTTDNAIVRWNGTGGSAIQDSSVTISDTDALAGLASLAMDGSSSGTLTMTVPAVVTSHTLTWPSAQGGANEVLTNNGSGALSWTSAGSGDVSAAANMTDNTIIKGDGGAKGVQDTAITIDDSENVAGMSTLTLPNAGLHLLDTNASHDLIISPGSDLTADRILTITTGDSARTITLTGNLNISGDLITSGDDSLTFTTTADTNVTLPTSGTLALNTAASDSVAGLVELATIEETDVGTDAGRAVTPDGLSGSIYGKKYLHIKVVDDATVLTTGDGKFIFRLPNDFAGMNLVAVEMFVTTVSSSGLPTVQLRNITQAADILTTKITIDSGELDSNDASAAVSINTSEDDYTSADQIAVDVDISGTGAKGLGLLLTYQTP